MSEMAEENRSVKEEEEDLEEEEEEYQEEEDMEEEEQEDEGQEYQKQEYQEEGDQEEEANFEHPTRPDEHISFLRLPVIKPGKTYIYPLWKFLLSRWLSKPSHIVYLATPYLDDKRMTDVCDIVIENPDTANIGALFVRRKRCYEEKKITEIIKNAMLNIPEDNHPIIKKTILEKIFLQMPRKNFHSKFIGCIYKERAEVLVTSANFTNFHFDIKNHESVVYHEMTKDEFIERFIEPMRSITEHDPSIST